MAQRASERVPAVSVVIPAYNQAHYLGDAVRSVLAQTFQDREIVVIDDGSDDDTPAVAAGFGAAVRYTRQDNQGLPSARNAGIKASRGQFVAFLDSDDVWLPGYLAEIIACFERSPSTAAVYTGWRHIDGSGQDLPAASRRVVEPERLYQELVRGNFVIPSAVVVRRDILADVGGFRSFSAAEDWDLWLRIARRYEMVGTPRVLVGYRLHDRSMTSEMARAHWHAVYDVVVDHFGPEPEHWREEPAINRRAFGGAHAFLARRHLEVADDEQAVEHIAAALRADPDLVHDLDFFYELGLGRQARGLKGSLKAYSDHDSACLLLSVLDRAARRLGSAFAPLHRSAYGTAHLALGLLAYGKPNARAARGHLIRAAQFEPRLMMDRRLLSTLTRVMLLTDPMIAWLRAQRDRRRDAVG